MGRLRHWLKLWCQRRMWIRNSRREPHWVKEERRKRNYHDNWRALIEDKYL